MAENEVLADAQIATEQGAPSVDSTKVSHFRRQLELEQNFPLAIVAGITSAIAGAILWAVITVASSFQISWMAVGVGFLVGYAVRKLGKGLTPAFGGVGATCALLGCLLGNLLSTCGFLAQEEGVGLMAVVLSVFSQPVLIVELLKATFSPIDLLFYGIAVYEGYKLSFREITEEELAGLITQDPSRDANA